MTSPPHPPERRAGERTDPPVTEVAFDAATLSTREINRSLQSLPRGRATVSTSVSWLKPSQARMLRLSHQRWKMRTYISSHRRADGRAAGTDNECAAHTIPSGTGGLLRAHPPFQLPDSPCHSGVCRLLVRAASRWWLPRAASGRPTRSLQLAVDWTDVWLDRSNAPAFAGVLSC